MHILRHHLKQVIALNTHITLLPRPSPSRPHWSLHNRRRTSNGRVVPHRSTPPRPPGRTPLRRTNFSTTRAGPRHATGTNRRPAWLKTAARSVATLASPPRRPRSAAIQRRRKRAHVTWAASATPPALERLQVSVPETRRKPLPSQPEQWCYIAVWPCFCVAPSLFSWVLVFSFGVSGVMWRCSLVSLGPVESLV
jgi:hypothetical protein